MGLLLRVLFLAGVAAVAVALFVPRGGQAPKARKGKRKRSSRPARRRRVTA